MQHEDEHDLHENKQVAVWLLGIMIFGFATSLFGWWIFFPGMALTGIVSLVILYKQKKPAVAGTTTSDKSKKMCKTLAHSITESE